MIEYKVRPVTRFIVTRYSEDIDPNNTSCASCETKGEFDNFNTAYAVGYALAQEEQIRRGIDLQSPALKFPDSVIYQKAKSFDVNSGITLPCNPKD